MSNVTVGKILVDRHTDSQGNFKFLQLYFIDTDPNEEEGMYTQIAHIEDFGEGLEVYTEFEAGGGKSAPYNEAGDKDIEFVVQKIVETSKDLNKQLDKWESDIKSDEIILKEECERISKIIKQTKNEH